MTPAGQACYKRPVEATMEILRAFPALLCTLGAFGLILLLARLKVPLWAAVLAYGCGHLGMMLSPLHLWHVVSNRYFNTTFGPVYRRIVPPAAVLAALVGGYFAALRTLLAAR